MKRLLLSAAVLVFAVSASAQAPAALSSTVDPWSRHALDVETGMLWKVGGDTPLNYRIVPFMVSWRTPEVIGTR
ncbi:MAG: hypothetical protein JNG86_04855, partial [Verrucomicrobiaceae bacterium]|nr:hypothetical protein [Verrucomicrobiaceae bacterium]